MSFRTCNGQPWFFRTIKHLPLNCIQNLKAFPDNAVEYFVSYYDYYQPEAYVPSKDLTLRKNLRC